MAMAVTSGEQQAISHQQPALDRSASSRELRADGVFRAHYLSWIACHGFLRDYLGV